jgi:Predicted dinucleotide-binding enzymes
LKNIYFDGKVLVDCTNPIDNNYKHSLDSVAAGAEYIQLIAKDAKVVKAFSINSPYDYTPMLEHAKNHPLMMLAGNSEEAKRKVMPLAEEIGFESYDVGALEQSLHLEHFAILYEKIMRSENASRLMIALYH